MRQRDRMGKGMYAVSLPSHITASVPRDHQSHRRSVLGMVGSKSRDGALHGKMELLYAVSNLKYAAGA